MEATTLVDNIIDSIRTCQLEQLAGLCIKTLAVDYDVNRSYLSRKFYTETKILLSEFIRRERILRAESLLRDQTKWSIKEIAVMVGFEKVDHFRKHFKRGYHLTPRKYQLMHKANL